MDFDRGMTKWKHTLDEEVYGKLLHYCLFITKNKWDGNDLAQESVLRALEHYDTYEVRPSLLKKIAYHVWVDCKRKEKRESLMEKTPIISSVRMNDVDDTVVQLLLERLTVKQVLSFVLKEAFQYKISEIAELLKMEDTGVKGLLRRARSNLFKGDEKERLLVLKTRNRDDLLYQTMVKTLTIQDPSVLIEKIPILLQPASSTQHHDNSLNVFSVAA